MSDLPPPPPAPPPGYQPDPYGHAGGYVKVGPWPRFWARVVDGLVLLVPNVLIGALVGTSTYRLADTEFDAGTVFLAGVLSTAISLAYSTYMESSRGQTVGKMALGLRVVGPRGGNPSTEEALRRNVWAALGLVPILGSLIVLVVEIVIGFQISGDPNGRGLHDNFAGGTMVTRSR